MSALPCRSQVRKIASALSCLPPLQARPAQPRGRVVGCHTEPCRALTWQTPAARSHTRPLRPSSPLNGLRKTQASLYHRKGPSAPRVMTICLQGSQCHGSNTPVSTGSHPPSLSPRVSVSLSLGLSLSLHVSVSLFLSVSICLSFPLSLRVCLSLCLSHLSLSLYQSLSVWVRLFSDSCQGQFSGTKEQATLFGMAPAVRYPGRGDTPGIANLPSAHNHSLGPCCQRIVHFQESRRTRTTFLQFGQGQTSSPAASPSSHSQSLLFFFFFF